MSIWIDGGWGVDALLGRQTREHSDVDIVIEKRHLPAIRSVLYANGFKDVQLATTKPWNFVLEDDEGCKVDVHVIVLDPDGNGIYGPPENGLFYPAYALSGVGSIAGFPVRCMSPEYQLANHTGYALRESDYHDVFALAEAFGLKIPDEYKSRRSDDQS
jgi:lincosamide nucleotidyltransferase A/C/D/E